jgi:hypothetical protein
MSCEVAACDCVQASFVGGIYRDKVKLPWSADVTVEYGDGSIKEFLKVPGVYHLDGIRSVVQAEGSIKASNPPTSEHRHRHKHRPVSDWGKRS